MPGWNHNIAYHQAVLRAVPRDCRRFLDVVCGRGKLTRKLASRCREVVSLDPDEASLTAAYAEAAALRNASFLQGDVLTYPFADASFDMVVAVAALHHLPLEPRCDAFERCWRQAASCLS